MTTFLLVAYLSGCFLNMVLLGISLYLDRRDGVEIGNCTRLWIGILLVTLGSWYTFIRCSPVYIDRMKGND